MADPAWRVINESSTGFHIFRIENMQVVPLPKETFGKFFEGDAYIIYSCTEYGQPGGPDVKARRNDSSRLEQHIHFWIGSKADQDEVTVAAYKSVELDDLLSGAPIQHREVQGHESNRFRSYFKNGIRIMEGGVATGLTHVNINDKTPKLFIVKGKRQPVIQQLKPISWSHFNDGDSFVLDTCEYIFVWNGLQANKLEKLQAGKLGQTLRNENGEGTVVIVENGQEGHLKGEEKEAFNEFLPLANKVVKPASSGGQDEKQDVSTRKVIKLYQCSDEDGTLRIREVKGGPLEQNDLQSKDSFIIDNGNFGIWVWVGKRASPKERTEAMRNAQGFIKKKGYAAHTPVTRVIDGGEPIEFKSLFLGWKDKDATSRLSFQRKISTTTVQTKFNAHVLHENPQMAAESGMVDDGKSAKEVYRVDHFDLVQVPEEEYGKFYSGDCYVVLYAYNVNNRDHYIIYYWLGSHSSQDEQGTAALKAVEIDDRLGGAPVQVRVVQGKEPSHFLAIFQGHLTIYQGGKSSSFDGENVRDISVEDTHLLQVHGRTPLTTYATQVPLTASSLNTNDCFVLVCPKGNWIWLGKGSTGDEREMSKRIGQMTDNEPSVVMEGQEKAEFWSLLGGKKSYVDERVLKSAGETVTPRLFHGSNASGSFKMEEVLNFNQTDLVTEDVMILDTHENLFVWLGRDANKAERDAVLITAKDYLLSDPCERSTDIPIIVVKQGFEPPHFTGFFGAWDPNLWPEEEEQMNGNGMVNNGIKEMKISSISSETGYSRGKTFAFARLASQEAPEGVDPAKKEDYLNDSEFEQHFGMDRECYNALPQWKQVNLKKKLGLF